ncbi:MAG: hypothetical protein HQ564_08610 [Candidatus Saganbacteria bacterium]|nr:hypothetical protein [Candidatus Saganbacteria bacterium]
MVDSKDNSFKLVDHRKAQKPFRFSTSSVLVILTGQRARHLKEFIEKLKTMPDGVIFYHVHNAFREYHFAPGKYTNDFAYWIGEVLGESTLAEKIANIEIDDYSSLISLKETIIKLVEGFLTCAVEIRRAPPGKEFYFCRNMSFIMPTKYEVRNLDEFCDALKRVGMRSLYFHFFEARLRLGHKSNDFSEWMRRELKEEDLALKIEKLNPYLYTLDGLRNRIIELIEEKIRPPFVRIIKKWLRLN